METETPHIINRYLDAEPSASGYISGKPREEIYQGGELFENKRAFRLLHTTFKKFRLEAMNGFRDLSKKEQEKVMRDRKHLALSTLYEGSFFPTDRNFYSEKVINKVDKIYTPHVKWVRTDSSNKN